MREHHVNGGLVAVIHAFRHSETVGNELHLGIMFFLVSDRRIRPQVVEWHGKRADVNDIFAFLSHRLRDGFHVQFAVFFVVDHFDVPHGAFLAGRLMSNDWDASFFGASALASLGTTAISFTFFAIKSSTARTCWAGSAVVGPTI